MKIVINACYGGFGLSPEAKLLLWERGKLKAKSMDVYVKQKEDQEKVRAAWEKYQKTGERSFMLHTLTPDGKIIYDDSDIDRTDSDLIEIVNNLGQRANGEFASLKVVEIPDGVHYEIEEYDGIEWVAETHRTWS